MMSGTVSAGYATTPDYQVITLPYVGGKLGFSILLPATGSSTDALLAMLRQTGLALVLKAAEPTSVELTMPKFTVHSAQEVSTLLASLGMANAFSDTANFSGITAKEQLQIQHVEHDAYVQVDENGTIAAAASGVGMMPTAVAAGRAVTVDRPFLFAITDLSTGLPLFLGRVADPNATN